MTQMTKTWRNTMKRNAATMISSTARLGYFVVPSIAQRGDDDRLTAMGAITWDRTKGAYVATPAGLALAAATLENM